MATRHYISDLKCVPDRVERLANSEINAQRECPETYPLLRL